MGQSMKNWVIFGQGAKQAHIYSRSLYIVYSV